MSVTKVTDGLMVQLQDGIRSMSEGFGGGGQAMRRTNFPVIGSLLYAFLGTNWLLLGAVQLVLGLSKATTAGTSGLPWSVSGTTLAGLWNMIGAIVYFAISLSILRRSRRGYDWGLTSALLSIPVVILTGGWSLLNMLMLNGYATVAVLLWVSRSEFKEPVSVTRLATHAA